MNTYKLNPHDADSSGFQSHLRDYAKSIANAISYIQTVSTLSIATCPTWAIPLAVSGAIFELGIPISHNVRNRKTHL